MPRQNLAARVRRSLYGTRLNDYETYHALLPPLLRGRPTVLDVGCGDGRIAPFPWHEFPDVTRIGLDPDPAAAENETLQRFVRLEDERIWEVKDNSIDLAVSRYVLEHVQDPHLFLGNLRRVLKPGGRFVFLTPNSRHPVSLISSVLPHRLKERILERLHGAASDDIFPTHYRMNTPAQIRALAAASGLEIERLRGFDAVPVPSFDFFFPAFLCCVAYHEVVHRTGLEKVAGISLLGVLRKPAS
jgi:SAM-dependent methyltransferase